MEILEKKLKRQLIGIERWRNSKQHGAPTNGCGTFWWYTAVGKTYAALIIAKRLLEKNSAATIVVIVPSEQLQKDWRNEVRTHVPEAYWQNVEVYTIHYLNLNEFKLKASLLIADEIHEYLSNDRIRFLDKTMIQYEYILGLTATWEDKQNRQRHLRDICPMVDEISESEALREGFISKYIEYNLACSFTDSEALAYKAYSEVISKNLPKFGNSLDMAQKCLVGGSHDGGTYTAYAMRYGWAKRNGWYEGCDSDVDALWNPNIIAGYARNLMAAIRERKNIIYNASDKAHKAVELVFKYPALKTICFAQSTRFADKLGFMINKVKGEECVTYHSKLETITRLNDKGKLEKVGKTKLRREATEKIRSGEARVISTASALDKGFNVVDIRMAITTSGTQNPTQKTQRDGRAKRLEMFAPDVIVLIVNMYVPNTVDEKWLRARQKTANNMVYWVDTIEGIKHSPVVDSPAGSDVLV